MEDKAAKERVYTKWKPPKNKLTQVGRVILWYGMAWYGMELSNRKWFYHFGKRKENKIPIVWEVKRERKKQVFTVSGEVKREEQGDFPLFGR